jgi:cell division transport system permease protein
MSLPYSFTVTMKSLFREKWINLLSVLTIASGLFIISVAFFTVYNIDASTRNLPEKFSMNIYLQDNLPRQQIDSVIAALRKNSGVSSVKFISKDDAMKEMKTMLKNSNYVLEGLDENPLPDSLEVKLSREAAGPDTAKKLADDALRINGVKEVDYGAQFLSSLHSLTTGLKTGGLIFIIVLTTGIVFVCYSTVKILFYRRNEEIETFKLLGATKGFIRTPFLIEGAVIGAGGGLVSLIGIFFFYYMVILRLGVTMPIFKAVLFPADTFMGLPVAGMFLGLTGATIALGRLKY